MEERGIQAVATNEGAVAPPSSVLQRLKPLRFGCVYAVAEATAYKDSRIRAHAFRTMLELRALAFSAYCGSAASEAPA